MNPYTSFWIGVAPGDGPQELHLVLLDNGRRRCLPILPPVRPCSASAVPPASISAPSTNAPAGMPTIRSTPGHRGDSHAQLAGVETPAHCRSHHLCRLYDVCPVKINIPEVLLHLRGEVRSVKQQNRILRPASRSSP